MIPATRKDNARPCGCRPMGLHRTACPERKAQDRRREAWPKEQLTAGGRMFECSDGRSFYTRSIAEQHQAKL